MNGRALLRTTAALFALSLAAGAPADVSRFTLPNGVRLLARQEPANGLVAVSVFVKAGAAEEGNRPGVGILAARALFGDNTNLSSDSVSRAVWSVGGDLEARWTADYTLLRCVTTRQAFADAFYIVAQALKGAQFDRATLERAREQLIADAGRRAADPFEAAAALLRPALHEVSPYGRPLGGTPDSLRRITQAQVLDYYRRSYTPGRTVVCVVGDIEPQAVRRIVENQLLPDYDRPEPRRPRPPDAEPALAPRSLQAETAGRDSVTMVGFRWPGVCDPDYPAGLVLAALVGGGKGSRLFRSVRDTLGVGYSVGGAAEPLARDSHLLVWVQYAPDHPGPGGKPLDPATVEGLVVGTVQSVAASPPGERELERARRYVIGTDALAHQRASNRAFYLGWYECLGAGFGFDAELPKRMAAVTAEDVRRAAQRYLVRWVVAAVGPAAR